MAGDDHDPEKAPNQSQRKKRIEKLVDKCSGWISDELKRQLEERTRTAIGDGGWRYSMDPEDETRLTLLFEYPSVQQPPVADAYIQRVVRIECGGKADLWPARDAVIKPYVAEAFETITDASIHVRALALQRTFWEKATILHAEAQRPAIKPTKRNLSRHYADTAAIADRPEARQTIGDRELRRRVVDFKEAFYANAWTNFDQAVPGTFKLLPADTHAEALQADYGRMRREMYFGPSMSWDEVINRLGSLEGEINRLDP